MQHPRALAPPVPLLPSTSWLPLPLTLKMPQSLLNTHIWIPTLQATPSRLKAGRGRILLAYWLTRVLSLVLLLLLLLLLFGRFCISYPKELDGATQEDWHNVEQTLNKAVGMAVLSSSPDVMLRGSVYKVSGVREVTRDQPFHGCCEALDSSSVHSSFICYLFSTPLFPFFLSCFLDTGPSAPQ